MTTHSIGPALPARTAAAFLAVLLLGACASYKPFEVGKPDDIKPGPGLLTGSEGRFVLYRGDLPGSLAPAPRSTDRPPPADGL